MEREYFDAKFEGLQELIKVQNTNLTNHIGAVSRNVKDVAEDLGVHEKATDAHGLGEGRRLTDSLAKWGSVFLAAIALVIGLRKHQ